MKFNLEALKAYIGGLLTASAEAASGGNGVAGVLIKGLESAIGWDIPQSIEGFIATGIGFAIGYVAVYFTPNKSPA